MKHQRAFCFFWILVLFFMYRNITTLQAQEAQDSINHYYQLAIHPQSSDDLASAYGFFVRYKESSLHNNYTEGAVHALSLLSIIQKESGFYYDSEASAIEALHLLETLGTSSYVTDTKITLYNQLGMISRGLKENERALSYYNKAFEIASDPKQFNKIINNRAFIYLDNEEFEKALMEFQKAYDISLLNNDEREMARNLDNLGHVKGKLNQNDALDSLNRALHMRVELRDLEGCYASYMHLFDYYSERDDQANAMLNLQKAHATAHELNSDSYKLDVLSEYMNLHTDTLVKSYKTLNDGRLLKQLMTENKYTSKKYDYSQKEWEAQRSEEQKRWYQLAGLAIAVIGLLSVLFLRTKHKKDRIEQVILTESRISKKIHDELANDVSTIMNVIQAEPQLSPSNKSKLLDGLQDVYERTRDISTETAGIDHENYTDSLRYLLAQHNKENVKVIVNGIDIINWKKVHHHKKLAIYRALQELMVNMKKHSNARLVTIVFKTNDHQNEIRYVDDGVGFDWSEIKPHGLKNAEIRMKEVGGDIKFETSRGEGFKAFIFFKS